MAQESWDDWIVRIAPQTKKFLDACEPLVELRNQLLGDRSVHEVDQLFLTYAISLQLNHGQPPYAGQQTYLACLLHFLRTGEIYPQPNLIP